MATKTPRPGPRHRALDIFVGTWRTTGTVITDGSRLVGTDTYEWLPGGFFLVHRVEAELGGSPVSALEMIGVERGTIRSKSFDNGGTYAEYSARLTARRWEIDGKTERFRGAFSADRRRLTGRWETRPLRGRKWTPWMDIELRKEAKA